MLKFPKDLQLVHYELVLTEDCNFNCTYCFDKSKKQSCKENTTLSIQEAKNILQFIKDTHKGPFDIFFIGGEPLMAFNILKYIVLETQKEYGPSVSYGITTNFSLYTREIGEFFIDHNINPLISCDGSSKANRSRVFKDGQESWPIVIKNILEFSTLCIEKQATFRPHIHTVISKENINYFIESYRELLSLNTIKLSENINVDLDFNLQEKIQLRKILLFLRETNPRAKILNFTNCSDRSEFCNDPLKSVAINKEGKLYFCHRVVPKLSTEDATSFGDIVTGYNYQFQDWVSRAKEYSLCKDCHIKARCKGGCIGAHYDRTKSLRRLNENACFVYREIAEVTKDVQQQ